MENNVLMERIQLLCDEHGISKRELAHKVGISSGTIYNWKTSKPRQEVIEKIADYFKVMPTYLSGMTDCRTPFQLLDQLSANSYYGSSRYSTQDKYETLANLCGPACCNLIKIYENLTLEGQARLLSIANDYSQIPKYNPSACDKET